MNYKVVFKPEADAHLTSIEKYLTSVHAETDFVIRIVQHCLSLNKFPFRHRERSDIRPGLRITGYKKRVTIAYTVEDNTVFILGIYYGGQDYETDLKN